MRRFGSVFNSRFAQLSVAATAAIVCGALLGVWISRISAGTPYPISPRIDLAQGAAIDPLDGIMTSAPLFGSRRPGGAARNMQAIGLIADANGQGGAIIAVEGQPPRAVRVGDRVEGRLVTAIDASGVTLEGSAARDTVPLIQKPRALSSRPGASSIAALGAAPVGVAPSGAALLGQPLDNGVPAARPPGYQQSAQDSPTGR